ncbi:MAG: CHASE3 domain-containing protein, partial [Spirochaetia bacterium]|nr:CHASE3 domain-containing protein [Spirochaetia bacterium]
QESQALLGHLRAAETGQRGYLLTEKTEYLKPYYSGRKFSEESLKKLKHLTADNSEQQILLDEISGLIKIKFQELEHTVSLTQKNKNKQAISIVHSDAGKKSMDQIRRKLKEFNRTEESLLETRQTLYEKGNKNKLILYLTVSATLIIILILLAIMTHKLIVIPVTDLTETALQMVAGKMPDRRKIKRNNEFGKLEEVFFKMSMSVQENLAKLQIAKNEAEFNEKSLYEIIWSSGVGTWQWNIDHQVFLINQRWYEMLGYDSGELENLTYNQWKDLTYPDDLKTILHQMDELLSDRTDVYECESRRHHKNGSWVWILDRGRITERNKEGKPVRISGTTADITNRKKAEIAKNEFISTVSHELRTPLTSIKGSLALLKSGVVHEPEKIQTMLEIALNNSDRLILLINDILDVSKMESGKMDFHFEILEVQPLIKEIIDANTGYAEKHKVKLLASSIPENITVLADRIRMIQVFSNLISNAAKFSPPNEEISLSASIENNTIIFSIKDRGQGIPEEFRDKIFEKFIQVDSSDTRAVGGTGLGLAIVKEIINKHKGKIWFESSAGNGTIFYVSMKIT